MAEFLSPSIFGQNNKSLSGQPADLTWWNYLKWDVPTCTRTNEKNTVFWTVACDSDTSNSAAGTITTSTFVLILACVIVTALIFILIFGCAIYRYRNETFKLQSKLKKEQQNFQKVDEYYRSKLREKSAQEKEREKAMQTARAEKAEKNPPQQNNQSSQLPQLIPVPSQYYLPFPTMPQFPPGQFPNLQYPNNNNQHHHRGDYDGDVTNPHNNNDNRYPHGSPRNPGEITRGEENRPNNDRPPNRDQIPPLRRSSSSDYERDEFATDTTDSKEFAFDRTQSHLASDHPARTLPPVDVLLLVDASSSIGNNQFEQ
uniref:Uncharacterized protein n=1 Tax=Panagrolaimus sp. PS1159 TaxID=55785 RepID=A0AC35GT80_9BILA